MSADYIIVGAGSSGCVLANRLSERHTVLLLEAGGGDDSWKFRIPAAVFFALADPTCDWGYQNGPEPFAANRTARNERGKILGGCSSINMMMYMRGQKRDYDEWASLTDCQEWSFDSVLPLFKRSERHLTKSSEFHGKSGEMQVTTHDRSDDPTIRRYKSAVLEAGFKWNEDPQDGDSEGFFDQDFTVGHDGVRQSTSRCFLDPIRGRKALKIETNSIVDKLILDRDNKRCIGVEVIQNGGRKRFECNKEVILSAGVFGSPCILQRSGLGPAELLEKNEIEVIADLPGVGSNLIDHVKCALHLEVKPGVTLNGSLGAIVAEMMPVIMTSPGEVTEEQAMRVFSKHGFDPNSIMSVLCGLFKSSNEKPDPDVMVYMMALSSLPTVDRDLASFALNLYKPKSTGYVRISSQHPTSAPEIIMNYLKEPEDVEALKRSLEIMRNIVNQKSIKEITVSEFSPGPDCPDVEKYIRESADTGYHPVGTCKMGVPSRDPMAVCDWSGKVAGVSGLRVADASIMPTTPTANTNAPCIMIGERISDFILQGL